MIVAFVVVVWAAYFVPLAVRRYDEASKSGSIDTLSSLSRVIPRQKDASGPEPTGAATTRATAQSAAATQFAVAAVRAPRAASRLAARRRRRTLLTLLAVAAVVGAVAGFGLIAWVWIAAPLALILCWLVVCRVQVRAERAPARPKSVKPAKAAKSAKPAKAAKVTRARKSAADAYDADATVIISHQFEDIDPDRKHVMQQVELEADALDEQLVIAVPVTVTNGAPVWDPLPVTLPTYVTKPRAGRTVRTIEFGEPGAWTSGHIEGENVQLPGKATADDIDGEGPQRQAVGH